MSDLAGPLEILGRLTSASNQTFLCTLGPDGGRRVVYKPVSGERPLWDFPTGTLADREFGAWAVSDALGWNLVPHTVLREGPYGFGMVQEWIDVDATRVPVDVVRPGQMRPGYVHVLDAEDGDGRAVELIHEDSCALARMAAFDVIVNNTDRKGGHILPLPDGHRYGVDHGVCFHVEDKLRTVLWGFAGRAVPDALIHDIAELPGDAVLQETLGEHLTSFEVDRFLARCEKLCRAGRFPEITDGWPAIPWPPF